MSRNDVNVFKTYDVFITAYGMIGIMEVILFMINIGQILKNAREDKELTQAEVMRLTGINRKSLSGYENNVAEPDLITFAELAKLYNLSADHVLGITSDTSSYIPSRIERQCLNKIKKLDQQHLAELNAMLDILVQFSEKD